MSAISSNPVKDTNKQSFWKKESNVPGSIKPVYGAQHPPLHESIPKKEEKMRSGKKDAFHDFENKTSDAWDDGDDDLLLMSNIPMSIRDVQSTARAVIDNHSRQQKAKSETQRTNALKSHVTAVPSALSGHAGPGVGVRLNYGWQPPGSTIKFSKPTIPDREAAKLKGYLPCSVDRRAPALERKRNEYFGFIDQYFETRFQEMHESTFRQILKDIPRMTSLAHLLQQKVVQEIFERILYIWAIRHPASGYVQGINDLVTPFFVVFLLEYIDNDLESENCDLTELPQDTLNIIEADSYWCMSKLLDGIQDNYTFAQPGIQMKVNALKGLIKRINVPLYDHLEEQNVEFLQFSFRWMNNLLMRKFPYDVQSDSGILISLNRMGNINVSTEFTYTSLYDEEIGELLAEAFKLKFMFC
ncbi:GYP1 [Mytilus edulis]|uniref:TBC1D22 n=1 Tax=Mytilus edulis TaxID=6550 RepID=A0A8S3RNI7_MYTED|nr:GYP1 [Mytilus edulis]